MMLPRDIWWGAGLILIGLLILIVTPPMEMSPWWFGSAIVGFVAGTVLIVRAFDREGW
jgi:hypothetical protein